MILGPLEVRSEEGPIALGGPRQRALLAALLLRAGRVVPTEQLVDELYGADPPQTATASLQNSVVALRKALGPDVLVTRPPGYVLAGRARAGRRAPLRAAARRREGVPRGASVGRSSAARSTSGAGRRSPSSPSRSGRRPRPVGSTSSGSSRSRSGSQTDVELGHAAEVVPELESLVRRVPATRAASASSSCARSRARVGQPTRSHAYDSAPRRARRARRSSRESRSVGSRRRSSATRPGSSPGRNGGGNATPTQRSSRRSSPDASSRCSASTGASSSPAQLAAAFGYPTDRPLDLARVSQYVATMNGSGPLYDELHRRFEAAAEPQPVHRFLAGLPPLLRRARRASPADHLDALRPGPRAGVRGGG